MQKEEIERLSSELSSYLLAIDNVKSISSPVIATLTAAKGVLESTRTFLTSTEAEINANLTLAPTDSLRENLLTTQSDLSSVNEAIRRIQECESNSAVCDVNGSVVVNTLETRVYYVRQSLSVIRKFLIDQDSYWAHAADSFRAQIKELLDSPQMKNPS